MERWRRSAVSRRSSPTTEGVGVATLAERRFRAHPDYEYVPFGQLSAHEQRELADLLDASPRPSVADLRAYLRANDKTLFAQVRRGGFVLGRHCKLPGPQ